MVCLLREVNITDFKLYASLGICPCGEDSESFNGLSPVLVIKLLCEVGHWHGHFNIRIQRNILPGQFRDKTVSPSAFASFNTNPV
ncbi:hypothetical protein ACOMICROBIO_NCLOACGD_04654 [Vibrio sp. B1ASS3]|nr:hypothetical protein ACOMICROBIO_NCLOACGD_04654 [Vibrio sp. B1ASS3]CAE6955794.1 hypothetical protein ACOMICROBIO_NCLOACGD_04654 [Vibrio sp. B1ASS3]